MQIEYDNRTGLQSRLGMVSIIASFLGLVNSQNGVPQMFSERAPFIREQASHMYRRFLFSSAAVTVEIPYVITTTFWFCFIVCSLTEVSSPFSEDGYGFLQFWGYIVVYTYLMLTIGFLFAFLAPTVEVAIVLVSTFFNMWNTTSGFTLPAPDIPVFWMFMYHANPLRVILDILASVAFYCDTKSDDCTYIYEASQADLCHGVEANGTIISGSDSTCTLIPRCQLITIRDETFPECAIPMDSCDCTYVKDQNNIFAWDILHETYDFSYSMVLNHGMILLAVSIAIRNLGALVLQNVDHNKR
eukprot:gene3906-4869_t